MKNWLISFVVLAAATAAPACPMCKDSVANDEVSATSLHDSYTSNGQNISGGINASVYLMLGALLGMMGFVSTVLVKGVRGANAQHSFPIDPKADDDDDHTPRS